MMNSYRGFRQDSLASMDELEEFAPPKMFLQRSGPVDMYMSSLKSLFESEMIEDKDLADSLNTVSDYEVDHQSSLKDMFHLLNDLLCSKSTFTLEEDTSIEREMNRLKKYHKEYMNSGRDFNASGNTFATTRLDGASRHESFVRREARGRWSVNAWHDSIGDVLMKKEQLNDELKDTLPVEVQKRQQYINQKQKMLGIIHDALEPPRRRSSRNSSSDSFGSFRRISGMSFVNNSTCSGILEEPLSPITVDSTIDCLQDCTIVLPLSRNDSGSLSMPKLPDKPLVRPSRRVTIQKDEYESSGLQSELARCESPTQDAPPKLPRRGMSISYKSERLQI
jgi:hypothetical protein